MKQRLLGLISRGRTDRVFDLLALPDWRAALTEGSVTALQWFVYWTRGETPLHRTAAYGDEAMIGLLLERGADREARDANGDSPLTWASLHLHPGRVLALLTLGDHRIGSRSRSAPSPAITEPAGALA